MVLDTKQGSSICHIDKVSIQGPVVQRTVSLTSLLRRQLVIRVIEFVSEGFPTYSFIIKHIDIFVEKMREAFAMQMLFTFFQQKMLAYLRYFEIF